MVALAAVASEPAASSPAAPRPWHEVLARDATTVDVHAVSRYRGADGGWHRLEVWRHGESFVHRRTDDRLDLYAQLDPQAAGHYRFQVLDPRRQALIEVDRTNLLRIGLDDDWFSLAHLLRQPADGTMVRALERSRRDAAASCDWYRLQPEPKAKAAPTLDICWSQTYALPVRILVADAAAEGAGLLFELQSAEAIPSQAPELASPALAPGYTFVDANADIDPAGD